MVNARGLWYIELCLSFDGLLLGFCTTPAEMIPYNLTAQYKLLQEAARERIRELQMDETNHWMFLAQLTRFGICPCGAMGRYSTCCGLTSDEDAKP